VVVIEIFACGVPVATVREKYNGAQGLVDDGVDGLVVELWDREIAVGVERTLGRNTRYKKISEAILRKAKTYDWSEAVIILEKNYMKSA